MPDVIDVAQEYEERHRQASLQAVLVEKSRRVGISHARDCESCGDPIPRERLSVQPDATHCVPCLQQRQRNYGR